MKKILSILLNAFDDETSSLKLKVISGIFWCLVLFGWFFVCSYVAFLFQ